ncbi:arylsulfatase B-like isoform X2 [Glandiceps talaboti]
MIQVNHEHCRKSRKPHIIYMLADDLGWNDVSWNNKDMITPNLQRLADQGVILDNLYTMPVCSPSRTALMTGMYPATIGTQHRVFDGHRPSGLPTYLNTLHQELKEQGYVTYHIGKWHLGFCNDSYIPNSRGVDYFYGFYKGGMTYYSHISSEKGPYARGDYNGFDLHEDIRGSRRNIGGPGVDGVYTTELLRSKTLEYMDNHDPSEPMFLMLAFQQPHSPVRVPKKWADMYEDSVTDLGRRNYSGQVTIMDDYAGSVIKKLEEKGMFENSLIIFSSDNGGDVVKSASNWPYRGDKGSYFEGGIKSAALVAGKGIRRIGYRNKELYHLSDMFPTLVESVAGGSINYPIDGVNIWRSLSTGSVSPRDKFLITIDEDVPEDTTVAAIRYGDYKLIEGYPAFRKGLKTFGWYRAPVHGFDDTSPSPDPLNTRTYLFNLRHDPYEEYNLADQQPFLVLYLRNKLQEYREQTMSAFWPDPDPNSNPQLARYHGFWSPGWC